MGLQEHQGQFVISAKSQEALSPRLLEIFRSEISGYAPDNLNMSGDTVSFSFTFASLFFGPKISLLASISRGTISVTPTDDGVIIRYNISFRQLVVVATVTILIGSIWMLASGFPLPFAAITLPVGWLWIVGMNTLTSILGFNHFIKKCAKKADATDIKKIKTITSK